MTQKTIDRRTWSGAVVRVGVAIALGGWLLGGTPGGIMVASAGEQVTPDQRAAWLNTVENSVGSIPARGIFARALAALRRDDSDGRDWAVLGDALVQRGRDTEDGVWFDRAERAYRHGLDRDPDNPEGMVGLAWVSGIRHEFETSRRWAEQALAVDPDNSSAHGVLGDAALELGQDDLAARHYQAMLDQRLDLSSYARAAQFVYRQGDVERAVELMHKAMAAGGPYPENVAWCRAQLAIMLWRNGQLAAAEDVLAPALTHTGSHVDVLVAAATLRTARDDYDAAIELYERAVSIAPHHDVLVSLADLYSLTGQTERERTTTAHIERLHARPADGDPGPLQVARYYADHDRNLETAVRLAEAGYQERPTPAAADILGWVYFKAGRVHAAEQMIGVALQSGQREADVLYHAGLIYLELGHDRLARQYLFDATSLNPSFHVRHARVASDTLRRLSNGEDSSVGDSNGGGDQ